MNLKTQLFSAVFVSWMLIVSPMVHAFMDEVVILTEEEYTKLSDADLVDAYIEVIVEMEASKMFHTTSGFTPKNYSSFKNLMRYRIRLLMEIHKRGLEIPPLDK